MSIWSVPALAGMLGVAWIEGLQSRHVGAVAKHLVCNDSETMRDGTRILPHDIMPILDFIFQF